MNIDSAEVIYFLLMVNKTQWKSNIQLDLLCSPMLFVWMIKCFIEANLVGFNSRLIKNKVLGYVLVTRNQNQSSTKLCLYEALWKVIT